MSRGSDNIVPQVLIAEGTAPSVTASGTYPGIPSGDQALFIDVSDHLLKLKNHSGTVSPIGGGKTPTVLLNYVESTDVDSTISIPATTWTDVNANQSFTVATTTDIIQICIQHGMQFLAGSGTPRVAMRAVLNSAGTPINVKYSSSDASTGVQIASPSGGSFYLAASALPAGASTIKLQIFSTTAGTLDIKTATFPDTEFIQIQVIEFE